MVNHPCPNCGEVFEKKSTFVYHINRKRPCKKITPTIALTAPTIQTVKTEQREQTENPNIPICIEIKNKETEKKFICQFCNYIFLRKFNLERHLYGRCKLKKDQYKKIDQEKNNVKTNEDNKKSNEDNKKSNEDDEKYNFILKRLKDLENENKKLKIKIKKTKKTTNININQNNNIINQNNILINFNDLRLEDVDKKLFTNPLLNSRLQGKFIILQMIENVYINESHPEYQNIMITDKNRGYVKIYNNGRWKTDNIETINMIIDGIISHSKNILIELKQQYTNNIGAKNRLNTSEKYITLCDLEYLADLEDANANGDANNTNQIKRCKDFREMVYKDTINLFHDNKNVLQKQKNNKIIEI